MFKPFFTFLFSICIFTSLFSQEKKNIIFNHIGQKELGNISILGIVRDDLGFIWFGTTNGLCKYDGATFRFIRHDPDDTTSLEKNTVSALVKDDEGNLWLGVDGAGLYKFDPLTEKLIQYKNNYKPLGTNRIKHLLLIGNTIYCGTYGGGLCVFDIRKKTFITYQHDDKDSTTIGNNAVFCLSTDKKGNIWLGLAIAGIDRFDPATKKFIHYNMFRNEQGEHFINYIFPAENDLVVGTSNGLLRLSPSNGKQTWYHHNEKDSTSLGDDDVCLITTLPDGNFFLIHPSGIDITDSSLHHFTHYKNNPADPYSVSNARYRNFVFIDQAGIVWMGSEYAGIDVIYPETISTRVWKHDPADKNSLVADNVFNMQEFGDEIWLGTYGAGASCFNRKTNSFKNFNSVDQDKSTLSNGLVYSFFMEDSIYMWMLTENGMNKVNMRTGKVEKQIFTMQDEKMNGEMYSRVHRPCKMLRDEKGNYWIAIIQGGLMYYETATGKFTRYLHKDNDPNSLSDNRIFTLVYDKKNNLLWLGTVNGGVNAFDLSTHKFTIFIHDKKNPGSITHDWAYTVVIDTTTEILWVGTDGGGLNALDLNTLPADRSKAVFHHFTDRDGLPSNDVPSIVPDGKGNVWLGHDNFLSLYIPTPALKGHADSTLYPKGIFKTYHVANGLPFDGMSQYALCFSKKDNRLYVGGEGFYSFNPDSIRENKIPPAVFITSFSIFDKPFVSDSSILLKKTITLSYDQNFISFGFAVLNYIFPEKNNVEWKLEGLDKEWNKSQSERFANYTNLDPGTYVFRVRGANNDGYRNEQGASITIIITPPFWKTNWFYILAIIFMISLIILYTKWRERKLKQDKKILEATVEERTGELKVAYHQIEEKNKDITDSINYARRIQDVILPDADEIKKLLTESFVLYKPKDIVSGDFYWVSKVHEKIIFAAVDCTGHGVPGAFMSLIGHNLLNEIVTEKKISNPSEILNAMRDGVIRILKQKGVSGENKDGMDISLCSFDYKTGLLEFAGAHNPLWIVRKNETGLNDENRLEEIKADKQPVGITYTKPIPFSLHSIQVKKGDCIYIFTDGYADQFGGEKGKKFKYKNLKELIVSISEKPMAEQCEILTGTIDKWRNGLEQNDDILVIGVKI